MQSPICGVGVGARRGRHHERRVAAVGDLTAGRRHQSPTARERLVRTFGELHEVVVALGVAMGSIVSQVVPPSLLDCHCKTPPSAQSQ